ncbi:FMN-linked oxidoreductase [Trametes versicolor FP-101664 SS1]|uniref:FMN-linked oxidoreductase n=1 Tax=Trametes versicolor (strain FP-101664) TaxID=717944 RepID=UPI00046245BB|nr:FMN-linked oxidoreductase [Trametes versicolor FP-101664 SS1]EIW60267.1 FMN-linked oxidoreductase [Trametes versicolor FP-101664 SS1]
MASSSLFQPSKVGDITLGHRVVLAPLTRCRANSAHVHGDLAVEYYAQRASVPGTLLIAEGTFIAPHAGGLHLGPNVPGIWNEEQIAAWKRVVDAVHARGSFIYLQLWALGRAADVDQLEAENPDFPHVGPSAIPLKDSKGTLRDLTTSEINEYVEWYGKAAFNAVHGAGFDGVEIHGANGYLVDQFIQDVSNQRTDEYGGSIENRVRFALEVVGAVVKAVGATKSAIRLSPWSEFLDMRMEDPIPTFSYLVARLREQYPDLAYIHVVEPGVLGFIDVEQRKEESNDFIRDIWLPRPLISAGRYDRDTAIARADKTGELIAFGRRFIANPDLPRRLLKNIPLALWDRQLFYLPEEPHGYIDYPFAEDEGKLETAGAHL